MTEDLFTRHDYKDQETNTNIQTFASTSINTQIEDLCGESIGVKTRKKRYSKISATNTISISATQSESIVEVNEDLLNKNEFLESDMKKKHVFVKKLLQNMNQNINYELVKQDLPHSNILNAVSAGISRALTIITSSPLESMSAAEVNEGENEEKGKKLLINIIGSEEEKMIYSEHEIVASMMIRKIGMTPAFKLKHAMFKKMLLKLITSFYEDKIKDPTSKIEYGVYVYSLLMKKYMMKKAAQNRFKHLLSSCVKYKNINRVRIFGRFIGLYGAFDLNDLNFYLTNAQNLKLGLAGKLFVNSETSEQHLTQYGRCLECLKYVSKSFPPTETQDLYHKLDLMKHVDKQSKITVVDIDEFLEVVIEKHHSHKSESYTFLKYIYDSADVISKQLNEDGYLQHREFSLLIRNLSNIPVSEGNRLFEAFAENFLSENDLEVRAISLENFVELHATNPIFTQEKVAEFTGVKNDLEAEGKLEGVHEELEVRLNEIQWRLSESKELGEYQEEFSNLLETLRLKIYSYNKCSNPKAVWLCLRLLEEESKILLIHDRLNELLPRFAQGVL